MRLKAQKKPTIKFDWLKCPVCERHDYYYRAKTNDYACKKCVAIFAADYTHHTTYLIGDRSKFK